MDAHDSDSVRKKSNKTPTSGKKQVVRDDAYFLKEITTPNVTTILEGKLRRFSTSTHDLINSEQVQWFHKSLGPITSKIK